MSIRLGNVIDIAKKVIISLLNSALIFYIIIGLSSFSNTLGINSKIDYAYLFSGLVFVISFLISSVGEVILILLVIGGITLSFLPDFKQFISNFSSLGIIELPMFYIIFLVILPLIQLAWKKNPRGYITAGSLALQLLNPTVSAILYFAGISFNEDYINGVLSALPYLILIYFSKVNIIPVILLFVASVLYSLNVGFYSLTGILPILIAYYFLSPKLPLLFYGIIVSFAINSIGKAYDYIRTTKEEKESTKNLKNNLVTEIKNLSTVLYSLKVEVGKEKPDLQKLIDSSLTTINNLQNKISECKNLQCLKGIEDDLTNEKRIITIEINNVIFDIIREYNDYVNLLKKLGINLGEIEYPKNEIKVDEFLNFYKQFKQMIEKNIQLSVTLLNNMIDNLSKTTGMVLDKINIIKIDIITSKINQLDFDFIDQKLNSCLNRALEIYQILESEEYEERKTLAELPLQKFTVNKLNNSAKILEKTCNSILINLSKLESDLRSISTYVSDSEIDNLRNTIEFELKIMQTPDIPYCEKISRVYNSLSELRNAVDLVKEKDTFMQLNELIDTFLPQILETGELKLSDIGINEKYGNYIVSLLRKKGYMAKQEGDKIIVTTKLS